MARDPETDGEEADMACNAALTIQVVGVEDATLLGLLTPELTLAAAKAALADLGLTTSDSWDEVTPERVSLYASESYSGYQIAIRSGRVRVSGPSESRAREIGDAIGDAMRQLGIALLGQRVAEQLAALSGVTPEVVEGQAEKNGLLFRSRY
jgi:hypothetical protein